MNVALDISTVGRNNIYITLKPYFGFYNTASVVVCGPFRGLIELVDNKACAELSSSCISYLHEPNYSVGSSGSVQFINAA